MVILCMLTTLKPMHSCASVGTVTGYQQITWGISTGRYYVNGIHAFCSEYNKSWPTVGTQITSIVPCTNEVIRKALYYGYNGPKNTLGTDEQAHVLTAIAISDAKIGVTATDVKPKYNTFYWDIVNNPSKYPSPPNNFKAFLAIPSSNQMQTLAFYEVEKNGYVTAKKLSSNEEITNHNPCYSLKGAEYGVYKEASCAERSKIGTITIGEDGISKKYELAPGHYYTRETVAPKGYKKSDKITEFTVSSEKTTTLQLQNDPLTHEVEQILQKVDKSTGLTVPQRNATLQGARFLVKFYAGLWEEEVDPATLGVSPINTWTFETDETGAVFWTTEYLIEGDELYKCMPLGTMTIQEIQAPEGYQLNETVHIRRFTEDSFGESVVVEEEYIEPKTRDIKLPETGSKKTIWIYTCGVTLCMSAIYLSHKKRRKTK